MQLIAERNTYRLESKGPARNRKGIRYVCPVTTGRLDVSTHPAPHLRKECCRKSITIPFSVHGKLRQKHVWGTREWFRSYARRTAVERFFGNIKGLTGIMRAGWTLQVGLVKLQLMTAITVMAHNLKTLLRWTKAHGANGSFIAAIEVAEVEIIDPSPGIDPASLPEHLQPA
nr:transposase [Janibacter cremeus]